MESRKISFWEALKAGRPTARYEVVVNGTALYLSERQYRALAGKMDDTGSEIRNLRDAKADAETAVAVYREIAEEMMKKTKYNDGFIDLLHEEIGELEHRLLVKDREITDSKGKLNELQIKLSNNTNGSGNFDFLKTEDPAVQKYAAEFLRARMPKKRRNEVKIHTGESHSRPKRFNRLLASLGSIPYVTEIEWHGYSVKKTEVAGIGEDKETQRYFVVVNYSHDELHAKLKIYTTAKNDREASFVGYCIGLAME